MYIIQLVLLYGQHSHSAESNIKQV